MTTPTRSQASRGRGWFIRSFLKLFLRRGYVLVSFLALIYLLITLAEIILGHHCLDHNLITKIEKLKMSAAVNEHDIGLLRGKPKEGELDNGMRLKTVAEEKKSASTQPPTNIKNTTIFIISLQGTPGAHESNNGRLDLFKEKWRNTCGSSSVTHINFEHCPGVIDKRRGYGLTTTWMLCLWRAKQLDEEYFTFLEDDARLFENSTQTEEFCDPNQRRELLSKLPGDTFLAFMGGHSWSYEDSEAIVPYRRVRHSYGAYGMIIPRYSLNDFHSALSHGIVRGSKDRKLNVHHNSLDPEPNFYRAARECHKRIYAYNPLVIWHEGGYSNTWGKVRGNITGLEKHKQGIKMNRKVSSEGNRTVKSGNSYAPKLHSLPPQDSNTGIRCTFCKGENTVPDPKLVVPGTGGKNCGNIMMMAAREVNGSGVCAILRKEESVCCPSLTPVNSRVGVDTQTLRSSKAFPTTSAKAASADLVRCSMNSLHLSFHRCTSYDNITNSSTHLFIYNPSIRDKFMCENLVIGPKSTKLLTYDDIHSKCSGGKDLIHDLHYRSHSFPHPPTMDNRHQFPGILIENRGKDEIPTKQIVESLKSQLSLKRNANNDMMTSLRLDDTFSSNIIAMMEKSTRPPKMYSYYNDDSFSPETDRRLDDSQCDVKCTAEPSPGGTVFQQYVYGTDWLFTFSIEGEVSEHHFSLDYLHSLSSSMSELMSIIFYSAAKISSESRRECMETKCELTT